MQHWFTELTRRFLRGPVATPVAQRWVVLDVETSGLDTSRDALISIGAVALRDGRVIPGDSLELVVRQAAVSSRENILVHQVGRVAQLGGVEPAVAVKAFLDYVGRAPLLAFHAPFDRSFLARVIKTTKATAKQPFNNPWLDLAELAPVLEPRARLQSLDDWLAFYAIPAAARHSAAGDAFATALLAARLLPEARRQGASSFAQLQALAQAGKWVR